MKNPFRDAEGVAPSQFRWEADGFDLCMNLLKSKGIYFPSGIIDKYTEVKRLTQGERGWWVFIEDEDNSENCEWGGAE